MMGPEKATGQSLTGLFKDSLEKNAKTVLHLDITAEIGGEW